jgi:outer membrane phospholipase A
MTIYNCHCVCLPIRVLTLLLGLITGAAAVPAPELVWSFNSTNATVAAGTPTGLWLNVLNPAGPAVTWSFPETIGVRITSPDTTSTNTLTIQSPGAKNDITLAPGSFARREYLMTLPESARGRVILEFLPLNTVPIALEVGLPPPANTVAPRNKSRFTRFFKDAEPLEAGKPFDPGRFFEEHISPHEPMYFIAGTEAPNAKFQISFKYQLLNEAGWLARQAPALKGFEVAYTQTSLWDLDAPSAPFFDTSYKPAFLYSWERVVGGQERDRFRLDLQGGLQHESNGKNGVDSRSQNYLFFRPTLVFGRNDSFQLTLQPRVWGYVGDLSDNPDLDEYRGYFDLRAVIGWRRGLQLAALGRMGHEGNNSSAQFDLTYPMMRIFDSFSVYLQAQYFTGYGDSLLRYNQRSDVVRLGFALYR